MFVLVLFTMGFAQIGVGEYDLRIGILIMENDAHLLFVEWLNFCRD